MSEETIANEHKDFFISYADADRSWAEWIAWHLEEEGYHVVLHMCDFQSSRNFFVETDEAAKMGKYTIVVLSSSYLQLHDVETVAIIFRDLKEKHRSSLAIQVQPCNVEDLSCSPTFIDLVELDEQNARKRLLQGIDHIVKS